MENNAKHSKKEQKEKIISNIQDFLNYKRTNSIDFGSRLLKEFKVVDFSGGPQDENLMVKFEEYDSAPHSNHYWVSKRELEDFLNGNKDIGAKVFVDNIYTENNHSIIEVNLLKNGLKKPTINDAEKLKGINIVHKNILYKSYDVQVAVSDGNFIQHVVKVFVFEPISSEIYINKHTVVQNKIEIKNGITFEDFNTQEQFVRKFDALEAIRLERKSISDELRAWCLLNMSNRVDDAVLNAFLKKIKEII